MTRSTLPAPQALHFGSASDGGGPLFGWFHPAGEGQSPLAALLCAPLGHEDLATHRSLRRLAGGLAAAGVPTLRFDYAGWGDSADADPGVPQLDAVQGSLQHAADALKARSGAARIALVGVRLGALLAALAATRRDDVDALVALLPVASGRAWLRESRLVHGAAEAAARERGETGSEVEIGGLVFDAATVEAVSALRWPTAGVAPQALLVERDDLPVAAGVADALRAAVEHLDAVRLPGLDRVTAVAHFAVTPQAALDHIQGWLVQRRVALHAVAAAAAAWATDIADANALHGVSRPAVGAEGRARVADAPTRPAHPAAHAIDADVTEQLVHIGESPRLVGMLTRPLAAPPAGVRPRGILVLPSGAERRIGPNRLWVPFARQRAAAGDVVLRLDLASLGDSDNRPRGHDHDVYDPQGPDDIAAALAWLRAEQGIGDCIAVGLCSGAYQLWRAALGGLDFSKVVAVNPVVFHWKPGMSLDPTQLAFGQLGISSQAFRSMRDHRRWAKLLRGQVNLPVILSAVAGRAKGMVRGWGRGLARGARLPLVDDLASELRSVVRRGITLDFVFAETDSGRQLLAQEAGRTLAALRRRQRIRVRVIAGADHTFTRQPAREALYRELHALLGEHSQ